MLRRALEKFKKTPKDQEAEGSSLQERLNQMRRAQPEPSGPESPDGPHFDKKRPQGNGYPDTVEEDEAFLRRFEEQLREKPSYEQTNAEILREQAEERRRRLGQKAPQNGIYPNRVAPAPRVIAAPKPVSSAEPTSNSADGLPPCGAILRLSDEDLAIFNRNVPARNYQLVYMINGDGSLSSQGIYLSGYEYEQIGQLAPEALAEMQDSQKWDRDILIFHLNSVHHVRFLPKTVEPVSIPKVGLGSHASADDGNGALELRRAVNERESGSSGSSERPPERMATAQGQASPPRQRQTQEAESNTGGQGFVRGRRFRITMGRNRTWEAVYWGRDEQGPVIAHSTSGQWTLMHLDLDRFASSIEFLGDLDAKNLHEVEKALREQYS